MEPEKKATGGYASAYLNRWHLQAWFELAEKKGMKPWQYAKVVVIRHLVDEGMVPQIDLDREMQKLEARKENPHGNTRVKAETEEVAETKVQLRRRRRLERIAGKA